VIGDLSGASPGRRPKGKAAAKRKAVTPQGQLTPAETVANTRS